MKKLLVSAAAAAIACAAPASAASFLVTPGVSGLITVPGANDFKAELAALGFGAEAIGATVTIVGGGHVAFEFLGSESDYFDTLSLGNVILFSETTTGVINQFASPQALGSYWFNDGDTFSILFSNNAGAGGRSATSGDDGFAVFLKGDTDSVNYESTQIVFGYDDQANPDDNHDDLIIRATISPVPEPATWAMMVSGIAAVGFAMRRRPRTARVSFS